MEAIFSGMTKSPFFSSPSTTPTRQQIPPLGGRSFNFRRPRQQDAQLRGRLVVDCAKGGPILELEREWENELKKLARENCKGGKGIVELMECLEREAIMGEDEGREPVDYNRRAQIFDKSSILFQALKESNSHMMIL